MSRLPVLRASEIIRALERDGWQQVKSRGGHRQLKHSIKPGRVTVPFHGNTDIESWLLRQVLRQAGLSVDQFLALL